MAVRQPEAGVGPQASRMRLTNLERVRFLTLWCPQRSLLRTLVHRTSSSAATSRGLRLDVVDGNSGGAICPWATRPSDYGGADRQDSDLRGQKLALRQLSLLGRSARPTQTLPIHA